MRKFCGVVLLLCTWGVMAADVNVDKAWAKATLSGQTVGTVFMTLTSKHNMTLTGINSTIAEGTELHEMTMEQGIMKMRPLPKLPIPAGTPVLLAPGSTHIMLINLKSPLIVGRSIPLTLQFQNEQGKTSTQEVSVPVQKSAESISSGEHGGHHH